jgi:hypothetical protein
MRFRPRSLFALILLAVAAGCGAASSGPPAPKSLTAAQVRELPLEEAGDLSIRQNLAETPKRPLLGRDTPLTSNTP